MSKHTTIKVAAAQYIDHDDCLAAAAEDYVSEHPVAAGYDLAARWQDDERDAILLDVPNVELCNLDERLRDTKHPPPKVEGFSE
jgi:hypothetical protein